MFRSNAVSRHQDVGNRMCDIHLRLVFITNMLISSVYNFMFWSDGIAKFIHSGWYIF
jgi:hypothetical protein